MLTLDFNLTVGGYPSDGKICPKSAPIQGSRACLEQRKNKIIIEYKKGAFFVERKYKKDTFIYYVIKFYFYKIYLK